MGISSKQRIVTDQYLKGKQTELSIYPQSFCLNLSPKERKVFRYSLRQLAWQSKI